MGGHKRSRSEKQEEIEDHPFFISYPKSSSQARKKQPKTKALRDDERTKFQDFPISNTSNLGLLYIVEPGTTWQDMTSYKSFVLGGFKYKRDDFVFVANERTVKRRALPDRKSEPEDEGDGEEWIAHILEVRASDVNHVYARVHWMYRSYELPPGISSLQPYNGKKELIFSNHMDIIDVLSVTGPAEVQQVMDVEEETQDVYFWRQAYDWRSRQLSLVERIQPTPSEHSPNQ
ncbi:hypothetical protein FLONG3_7885 [Fusarium longipes]|uniref:BAH domain-containing protein n=1 Tax=Fusarium longipes TaxID=694270 RepID=A0A395SAZ2_9HYPO|nr:hypothetical protein FLONG3_7885 [Fusarium longipes]